MTILIDPNRCNETPTPLEGEFLCDNAYLAAGTKCHFSCTKNKEPIEEGFITCKKIIDQESNSTTFKWDSSLPSFECVKVIRCL